MSVLYKYNDESWYMPEHTLARYSPIVGPSHVQQHQLHVPVLMPLIPFGVPVISGAGISGSCYCNASECKPNVGGSISVQNFIWIPMYDHEEFELPYFKQGATFYIHAIGGNVDDLHATHDVDSSVLKP